MLRAYLTFPNTSGDLPIHVRLGILPFLDMSSSVEDTEDTVALLLDRVLALEMQISSMQTTIDGQAATIVLLQNTDNSTLQRLDTVENNDQGTFGDLLWFIAKLI